MSTQRITDEEIKQIVRQIADENLHKRDEWHTRWLRHINR